MTTGSHVAEPAREPVYSFKEKLIQDAARMATTQMDDDANGTLRSHLYRRLRDPAAAEGVAQGVYARLLGVDSSTVLEPIAYLLHVASRVSSDYRSREQGPRPINDAEQERALLMYVMHQLPALERKALQKSSSGLTTAEIASELGLSRERTKRLLARALGRVSSHLRALREESL